MTLDLGALPPNEKLIKEKAKRRFLPFVKRMFPNYKEGKHHVLIADVLERLELGEITRAVITIPPRHGKSELASVHFPPWFLGRNPDSAIIACSYASALANRFSRRARNLLYDPRWPFEIETAGDMGQVQAWGIEGHRGQYTAAGVGGAITGIGANLLIIDDPVKNAQDAQSELVRDSVWDWYTSTAYTRLEPGGRVLLIGTRWHEDDLLGRALAQEDEQWVHVDLPALADSPNDLLGRQLGEALWPERYNEEKLEQIRSTIGTRTFTALYQQKPSPEGGGFIKRAWWKRYKDIPKIARIEMTVDSAFKTGVANDFSVIETWGATRADGAGDYFLLDVWRGKVEFPDLIRNVHLQYQKQKQRWGHNTIIPLVIEDKASGQSAIQTLSRPVLTAHGELPPLPVIAFKTGAQSKESRVEGISYLIEGGRVFIPEEGVMELADEMVEEAVMFPNAKHDDLVDAMVMGLARMSSRWSPPLQWI